MNRLFHSAIQYVALFIILVAIITNIGSIALPVVFLAAAGTVAFVVFDHIRG